MQTILKNPNSKKLAQTIALRSGLFVATALLMSACISQVSSTPNSVDVYKYRGSKQCEGGGLSQPEVEQKLAAMGATIYKKSCATDGKTYPAYCGNDDGKIYVFTIDKASVAKAQSQGFGLLKDLGLTPSIGCTI